MYNENYNKEDWVRKKNQERDETYRKIDLSAERTLKDEKLFVQYLDIQSRFSNYSVGNSLLISLQRPDTTLFRDKEGWNKNGVQIKPYEKGFVILEPSSPYVKPDGTKATYYNPKKMYDIGQTDSKQSDITKTYSKQNLLKAFIHNCPAEIAVVDKIEDTSLGAFYNKDENKLYICRGLEESFMFQSISSEMAKMFLLSNEDECRVDFKSYCASYMLCKKYGIDCSNYEFKELPREIKNMNATEFRAELSNMKDAFVNMDMRVSDCLEKGKKSKEQVR